MNNSLATQVKTPMAKAPQKQTLSTNDEVKEQMQESSQITQNQATPFSSSHSDSFINSFKNNFFQTRYSGFPIQTKLTIGSPNDKYEREADTMANRIMRIPQSFNSQPMSRGADTIQRKCAACENEEENIRRKPLMMKSEGGTPMATPALGAQLSSSKGSGQALPQTTNQFMSSVFGTDFSGVRIHTGNKAVQMNQVLNARAFTHGSDVYFNRGQYNPGSSEGKRLLGHELTHTIQQDGATLKRKVNSSSRCAANTSGAPGDPIAAITAANNRAITMALGTSNILFLDSVLMNDPDNKIPLTALNGYLRRFGLPTASGNKFKNRFNNKKFGTVRLAQASEMNLLASRYEQIGKDLNRNIRFRCAGNSRMTISGCSSFRCKENNFAVTCAGKKKDIVLCPTFWRLSEDQRAVGLIHELLHMTRSYGDRDRAPFAQSFKQRSREPACYESLAADNYGIRPPDNSCPIIGEWQKFPSGVWVKQGGQNVL